MKKLASFFCVILAFSTITASDEPAEISRVIYLETLIPASRNAYGLIPGLRYEFSAVKDSFLFALSAGARSGAGTAAGDGQGLFGMYENEWRVPAGSAAGRGAFYLEGEVSADFGWNISAFFGRRQYVEVSFSGLFEREEIGGKVFVKLGRYSPCISLSSEIFALFGGMCVARIGYGEASYNDIGRPGALLNYIKLGIGLEFAQKSEGVKIYKRDDRRENGAGSGENPSGGGKKEEGETVW
jgi:hypothetical protein